MGGPDGCKLPPASAPLKPSSTKWEIFIIMQHFHKSFFPTAKWSSYRSYKNIIIITDQKNPNKLLNFVHFHNCFLSQLLPIYS